MPDNSEIALRQKQRIRRRRFGVIDQYPQFSAFDSFTRGDSASTPGSATEKGGAWSVVAGTLGITSGKLYCNGATAKGRLGSMTGGNGTFQATFKSDDWTNHPIQIMLRYTDASNFLGVMITSATAMSVRSEIAGVLTSVAGITPSPSLVINTAYVIKVVLSGTSVTVFQDGVQLGGVITLTAGSGGAGINGTGTGLWFNGSTYTTATTVDDYTVTA